MSVLTDIDIRGGLNRSLVIHPAKEDSITPLGYDLCIGFAANVSTPAARAQGDDKIIIPALSSTFVVSREFVWLSDKLVGTLHSRGSLAAKGLLLNSTTIDPNWSGRLTFLIFNSSDKDVELDLESTFVTLVIHYAASPTASRPSTNPITVASNYGDMFAGDSRHLLFEFLNSAYSRRLEQEFNEQVQQARRPSLGRMILDGWRMLLPKGRRFQSRLLDWFVRISLALGLLGVLTTFFAWESCRAFLQRKLGLDVGPYDNKVLALQVATFFVILGQLRSGSKKT